LYHRHIKTSVIAEQGSPEGTTEFGPARQRGVTIRIRVCLQAYRQASENGPGFSRCPPRKF
jgi:hypothetical protein